MLDNIELSDVVSLLILLVLVAHGGVFVEFSVYERPKMTPPPGFPGSRYA